MDPWHLSAALAAGLTLAGCAGVRAVLLIAVVLYTVTVPAALLGGVPITEVLPASTSQVFALELGYCAGLMMQFLAERAGSGPERGLF